MIIIPKPKSLAEWRHPALVSCFISSRLFSKIRISSHRPVIGLTQLYMSTSCHSLMQLNICYWRHKNHLFSINCERLHSQHMCKHWHVFFPSLIHNDEMTDSPNVTICRCKHVIHHRNLSYCPLKLNELTPHGHYSHSSHYRLVR